MNQRLRQERNVFLLFLGAIYVCLMSALPVVTTAVKSAYPHARFANAGSVPAQPSFDELDRNRDGYVDRAEALTLPGLDAVFNDADRRPDGRLDKVEYARALGLLDGLN